MTDRSNREKAAQIVRDAGGKIVGRTRLQKIACLLELAGLGEGFSFEYYHYGPYSEELSDAVRTAQAFDLLDEEEVATDWGGSYSIFTARGELGSCDQRRAGLIRAAAKIDAVELELAATAAFLAAQGENDPWNETARRKPAKARDGRLDRAKDAYRQLRTIATPRPLPDIA